MAALSMGAFGLSYQKYLQEQGDRERELNRGPGAVWVTKRYIPTDLRVTAPVPRHKFLAPADLPTVEEHWLPVGEPPLRSFDRREEKMIYASHPSSRSEEWSTLRQTLPSRGGHKKPCPPNWGTGTSLPPIVTERTVSRFPIVNSPMTRYVDDMHLTNRLFKLH
ncbi:uncharacterized protein LOC124148751 [Haliotis rufescens]|uniref:uncharacterized protein LOC124148751 n=1 Tax=Haliotis rufescens TaxID=6454 RepID=UPI001EB07313|nr:uncharacterized protein LOC124148751 [Haliotis rufescens]